VRRSLSPASGLILKEYRSAGRSTAGMRVNALRKGFPAPGEEDFSLQPEEKFIEFCTDLP